MPPTPADPRDRQTKLAFIGGFVRPPDSLAQGTYHAAYALCEALAHQGRHTGFDIYQEKRSGPAQGELVLPRRPPTRAFEKAMLRMTEERYQAIFVANGEQMTSAPHVLRPARDWAPVICSIGTAHSTGQWMNLLVSLVSGEIRPTDGFIFKSRAAERLFRSVWQDWSERLGVAPFPRQVTVIPNGVDVGRNVRSDSARAQLRRQLRIGDDEVLFLAFSRLSPGTKGDQQALVVRWKDVLERVPKAVLLLSGALVEKPFLAELRNLARAAEVGHRVLVLDNPFEIVPQARNQLMSAADVFLHLSTGVEETSSLVVHEAMAHSLPVITTAWAGMPEIVSHGETGFLIETRHAPVAPVLTATQFGQTDTSHAIAASRLVASDWTGFLTAVEAVSHAGRRSDMGAAARQRAVGRDLAKIAQEYCDFFASTSSIAELEFSPPLSATPMVDLGTVLSSQASRPLDPSCEVRLGKRDRALLLSGGLLEEAASRVAVVVATFEGRKRVTLADLAQALSSVGGSPRGDAGVASDRAHRDFEDNGRLLVRMLNFGVIEPVIEP